MKTNTLKVLLTLLIISLLSTTLIIIGVSAEEVDSLYVNAINTVVTNGSGTVFTVDFNGTDRIKSDRTGGGNFRWVTLFTCEPTNLKEVFKVTSFDANLAEDVEVVIPEGGFIYAAHFDDQDKAQLKEKSEQNMAIIDNINIGDYVTIVNMDLENGEFYKDAAIFLGNITDEEVEQETELEESEKPSETEEESVVLEDSFEDQADDEQDSGAESKDEISDASKEEDEGLSTPLIIAIVAGVLVLIGVVVLAVKKSKK